MALARAWEGGRGAAHMRGAVERPLRVRVRVVRASARVFRFVRVLVHPCSLMAISQRV
jgi:hypothetical protein